MLRVPNMFVSRRNLLKTAACSATIIISPILVSSAAIAAPRYYTGYVRGVAVGGYDPVAYFTKGKPTKGSTAFSTKWDGVTWRFANSQNMKKFLSAPHKYAPQFGGYCAYAVGTGTIAKGNPNNWKIVNGKLYLNITRDIQSTWERKQSHYIKQGNKNWPRVIK